MDELNDGIERELQVRDMVMAFAYEGKVVPLAFALAARVEPLGGYRTFMGIGHEEAALASARHDAAWLAHAVEDHGWDYEADEPFDDVVAHVTTLAPAALDDLSWATDAVLEKAKADAPAIIAKWRGAAASVGALEPS